MPKRKLSKSEEGSSNSKVAFQIEQTKKPVDDDDAYADTDTEMEDAEGEKQPQSTLFRLSSRLASMKRRGKEVEVKEEYEEFEYFAEDCVTVRAPGKDFYLCRILDDVPESTNEEINIAWFDQVGTNRYKVSYDDTIYKASIISHVGVKEVTDEPGLYYITPKTLKNTKSLLKETLTNEGEHFSGDDDDDVDGAAGDDESAGENEEAPTKKKSRKKSTSKKTPKAPKGSTKSASPKKKSAKRGNKLIPNPDINLLEEDPTYSKDSTVPLSIERQAIKAVITNDDALLEALHKDGKNCYTLFQQRSPQISRSAYKYALLQENLDYCKLMLKDRDEVTAKPKTVDLSRKDTGKGDYKMFGHAVREVTVSRGNREGNNAFLADEVQRNTDHLYAVSFCIKKNISIDFVKKHLKAFDREPSSLIDHFYEAVQTGNREMAGEIVKIAIKKDGYGFNFLHDNLLNFTKEKLPSFKAASVTKKTHVSFSIAPMFCACINPNAKYLQEVLNVHDDINMSDNAANRPIHYAAACSGPGPLKLLISRGADVTIPNGQKLTPLIIAVKCNRVENIAVLMSCKVAQNEDSDDDGEDEEDETTSEKDKTDEANTPMKPKININAKDKKTFTALHHAAKRGFNDCIKVLLENNANVNIKSSAVQENMTPLGLAAAKGHYETVKFLHENGAKPDLKMRRNKTALMYACMNGHSQIVAYLLRIGVNPDARDSSDNTPIHYAAAYGWYHCVKLLLEGGADANIPNNWKTTPLAVALMKHYIEIGDLLLDAGVDVNFVDENGLTILMKHLTGTLCKEQYTLVKHLLEKYHANPQLTDGSSSNLFHYLARSSIYTNVFYKKYQTIDKEMMNISIKIAELFLKAGVDINGVSDEGVTPLITAVANENFPLTDFLLENGASATVGKTEDDNKTVLHFIDQNYDKDLSAYVVDKSFTSKSNEESEKRGKMYNHAQLELLKNLLKHGADVNSIRKDKHSLFTFALSQSYLKICEILLDDPNIDLMVYENKHGQNVLHMMLEKLEPEDKKTFQLFHNILKKCNLTKEFSNKVDNNGFTPLLSFVYNIASKNQMKRALPQYTKLVKTLLTECFVDTDILVQKTAMGPDDKPALQYTLWPEASLDYEKSDENQEKFKGYNSFGQMNIFHLLAMKNISREVMEVFYKHVPKIGELLNAKDLHGRTPLHYKLMNTTNYTQDFLDHGANVEIGSSNKEKDELAPTLVIAMKSWIKITKADEIDEEERFGGSSTEETDDGLLAVLKECKNVNLADQNGMSAAHHASLKKKPSVSKKIAIFKRLLKAGLDVNAQDDKNGRTVLHNLVMLASGDYETTNELEILLISHGALLDVECSRGRFPIHYAFFDKSNSKKLDSTNICDPMSLIHLLCTEYNQSKFNMKDYVSHQDNEGNTPLHYGCQRGATISCMQLKKLGADDKLTDKNGNTPLAIALKNKHHGTAMMMLQEGADPQCNIYKRVTKEQIKQYEEGISSNKYKWDYSAEKPEDFLVSAFVFVLIQDWKDLAYIMLEVSKLPMFDAIQAGISEEKLHLIWTLLAKHREYKATGVDEERRNLLHLLCIHVSDKSLALDDEDFSGFSFNEETGLLEKEIPNRKKTWLDVAKYLINCGINIKSADSTSSLPIHYAVENNFPSAALLVKLAPSLLNVQDGRGRTPIVRALLNGNVKSSYPISRFLIEDQKAILNVAFRNEKGEATTLINECVLKQDTVLYMGNHDKEVGCLEYILEHGADVDFVAGDADHDCTALMLAIKLNCKWTVGALLKHEPNLDHQDKKGFSYIHACVQTSDYASHEDVEMLKILVKAGAPMNLTNNEGQTPFDMAKQQPSGIMANKLAKYKAVCTQDLMETDKNYEQGFKFTKEDPLKDMTFDYKADHKAEIEDKIEKIVEDYQESSEVDHAAKSNIEGTDIEVYIDPVNNKPYDTTLIKTLVKVNIHGHGQYGINSFYKMQVIHHKAKGLYILFNRWGRVGLSNGQHQQTPFDTAEAATSEFKKIFRSKTANEWSRTDTFEKKAGKYNLLAREKNPERMKRFHKQVLKPFLDKSHLKQPNVEDGLVESRLDEHVYRFMKDITNYSELKAIESFFDKDRTPFGLISTESIQKGKEILQKIQEENEIQIPRDDEDENQKKQDKYEKLTNLTNEFYSIIPFTNFDIEDTGIIKSHELNSWEDRLKQISDVSFAFSVLLAAQHRIQEVNPYDYCLCSLDCRIEHMSAESDEAKLISKYIYREGKSCDAKVTGMFRVKTLKITEQISRTSVCYSTELKWRIS